MRVKGFLVLLVAVIYVQGVVGKVVTADKSKNGLYVEDPRTNKSYRLMYAAMNWANAKGKCEEEDARLAVPKSKHEFKFLQRIVRGMYYPNVTGTDFKLVVWLGINNLENYKVWANLDGENIENTGFHEWVGDNGNTISDNRNEPHCVVIDALNPGLRDWWCRRPQPYICERGTDNGSTSAEYV